MYGKSEHLIHFFLHFVVVITCIGKTFFTFRTIAPLSLNDFTSNFVNGFLCRIYLLAVAVKNSISILAGFLRIFKRRKSTNLRLSIRPGLSYSIKLFCRRCRGCWCRCRIHISLYFFLELCPMRQNVRRTHLVRISCSIEIVYRATLSVTDI